MTPWESPVAGARHQLAASRRLAERLEAERDRLEAAILRTPTLLVELNAERLLVGVAELACELAGARFGLSVRPEGGRDLLVGPRPDEFRKAPILHLAPLLAATFETGRPLRADDVTR